MRVLRGLAFLWVFGVLCSKPEATAETFRVATYNLDNYLQAPSGTRPAKPAEGKAKIRESLRALQADVLALQEMGTVDALLELRTALKAEGLDYTDWELVNGHDTNIHVAVLSKFPTTARRPHTNESFLLFGRRLPVSNAEPCHSESGRFEEQLNQFASFGVSISNDEHTSRQLHSCLPPGALSYRNSRRKLLAAPDPQDARIPVGSETKDN